MQGLPTDGGLFVPTAIPAVDRATLAKWRDLSYADLAVEVMSLFISSAEVPPSQLRRLVEKSYG